MAKDLRYFLERLTALGDEEYVEVHREVDPKYELSAVLRKLQAEGRYPAVLFHRVKGTRMKTVSNLFASRKRLALALESSEDRLLESYMAGEESRMRPKKVDTGPVKDRVLTGDDVNLEALPRIVHCEKDAGPYITAGVMVTRDAQSGAYDLGIFRMQFKGRNKIGVLFGDYSKAARVIRMNETENKPTECAVFIGHHPACILASQTKVPYGIDEYEVASGLLNEQIEITECETVDLEVPSRAEVVLEGIILPRVREPEGPFGEYTWYYGQERESHVMQVTAITYREEAIFHDIFSAHPDHNMTALIQREAVLYKRVKMLVPSLRTVRLPISGVCRHVAYISIKKEFDGQGKLAALAALAADPLSKLVIVVDDDIDVANESEVMWAVATRVQADRAIFVVPEAYVSELDPSSYSIYGRNTRDSLNTKWAIDATKPVGLPFEERADVPAEVWQKIDLKEYLKVGRDEKQLA
ncbi:MAG: UbiD family decarboxylase [Candidatus Caldarchaeum sp.]